MNTTTSSARTGVDGRPRSGGRDPFDDGAEPYADGRLPLPGPQAHLDELSRQAAELKLHLRSLRRAMERAADPAARAHLDYLIRQKSRRLAGLTDTIAEAERELARRHARREDVDRPVAARAVGGARVPADRRSTARGRDRTATPTRRPTGQRRPDPVDIAAADAGTPHAATTAPGATAGEPAARRQRPESTEPARPWLVPGPETVDEPPPTAQVYETARIAPVFEAQAAPVYEELRSDDAQHAAAADPSSAEDSRQPEPETRTDTLVNRGRRNTYPARLSRRRKVALGTAAAVVLGTILGAALSGGGGTWPASVATVRSQVTQACRNPNVAAEPNQVNFACGGKTRQILWVFALLTSDDRADFVDSKTGRRGLEPITPAQGGDIAWSLNLHHPYDPADPIDSIEVAARAINNIIGGATLTSSNGKPVIQDGLESDPANCARYTGSAAVRAPAGFPPLCAKPVTSPAGQAALVADVYAKWVVGAPAATAHDAAVLFENADNPGNPQVQAILRQLQHARSRT